MRKMLVPRKQQNIALSETKPFFCSFVCFYFVKFILKTSYETIKMRTDEAIEESELAMSSSDTKTNHNSNTGK